MMRSSIDQETLRDQAENILTLLTNRFTSSGGLEYFTVGDQFGDKLLEIESEILTLPSRPRPLEWRVIGDFGSGKTHFLTFLHWLLQRDAPKSCIISRADITDLRNADD